MIIRENIKKHDQLSLEIKLEFPFSKKKRKRKDNYYVDMYLFLPYALDVNKHSFTKEDFYNSLKTYIRLTTPTYSLPNMLKSENSPLQKLKTAIEEYITSPDDDKKEDLEIQVKRFCSIFGTAMRHAGNKILKTKDANVRSRLIDEFSEQVTLVRDNFKELENKFVSSEEQKNAVDIFHFADEYQSLLTERNLFVLITDLEKKKTKCDKAHIEKLNNLVLYEMNYREEKGYPSIAYINKSNEYVLHRASRLKKFIESNLFLNTDTKKDGVVFEQILFALAAGLAMIFATGVAFASQMIYGNLTLPFFIALVISYMFKDRIKELVRIYLDKKQHKFAQDFRTYIYDQSNKKIGFLKESFNFVKCKYLSTNIINARDSMRVTEISKESMGEKIILYRNKIKIYNKRVRALHDFSGTTEILRLNISDFTKNMDDPQKELFLKTKNGFKRGFAKRSYHLNLILNYSDGKEEKIKLYKLIVDRNGINRIERFKYHKTSV